MGYHSMLTIKKRVVTVFLCVISIFMVIMMRLFYVQFFKFDALEELATESWTRNIPFEASRGIIYDTNNEVIVKNVSAPTLIIVPRQLNDTVKTAEKLAPILNMNVGDLEQYMKRDTSMVRFQEGRKLTDEQAIAIQNLNLPGIYLAEDSKRHYPHSELLAHVLGFSGIDNQGLIGIEAVYDERLRGEQGHLSFYSDAKGKRIDHQSDLYKPPIDGEHLRLTIDLDVQKILERELDQAMDTYQPDGAWGLAVNPNTGAILGMGSRPSFDPNHYKEVDASIYDRNFPIWSTYEPGSTFKIVTLAAALEEQIVDLHEDSFYDKGSIDVAGAKLRCWKRGGHGDQSYLEVVENSCNPGFVKLGQGLGADELNHYIDDFGFGKKTGVDLLGESTGILFAPSQLGEVELATTAFGQGISVTPIQQVMAVSAAVNGGKLYQPYIVQEWLDPITNKTIEENKPQLKKSVISNDTSLQVAEALESVVANGTGRAAFVEGYRVGGKTGTAQKVGSDGRYLENNHIVSFIGFAPANQPEIVVYVAVDNPKDTVQFGGVVAAPIVGRIIHDSLQSLGVQKQSDGLEKDYQWPEEPLVEVPDFIGERVDKLHSYYLNLSTDLSGEGDFIIDQSPDSGTKVPAGETIRLLRGHK
ncbi:stage V sporulation protein D (sporulation-specific penicillin-binding protein) [Pelagirhabdus alkalitolerans]|uniref:serine-type D-Ala-D-Ala carboxypeptidase n=1 Tax=Pelagirhabdus alkalitolerans TaxID=1612202 RepID=A0A1G6H056_9BACI|nr:stage V sporulation protein D [Pelagirhabdus alkalitolerans]SDB87528.1 stage V sporulation protein D (sporulation-specific penicillin-binding protein) [Pelagirhabdus alkalitolerans]